MCGDVQCLGALSGGPQQACLEPRDGRPSRQVWAVSEAWLGALQLAGRLGGYGAAAVSRGLPLYIYSYSASQFTVPAEGGLALWKPQLWLVGCLPEC